MNSRDPIGVAVVAGATSTARLSAADSVTGDGQPTVHDHGAMASPYGSLVAASSRRVDAEDAFPAYRIAPMGDGDRELAACARAVQSMLARCTALRVVRVARVVADTCRDYAQASVECARGCERIAA